ncbi:MAG: DUF6029 family protein [Chitinophagaceae bacterium]
MKKISLTIIALTVISNIFSQQLNNLIKGHLNGSFENYSQYYMNDEKIGAFAPFDKVGTNNFLKLDYTYGNFTTGIQYESYLPSILGYNALPLNQSKIANKYFKYSEENYSIQVGDFYEQFGSGLIFRAFENRQIGINNALEGVNVYLQPTNFSKLKVIYGKTRKLFEYSNSITRGIDAEFDLTKAFGKKNKQHKTNITIGGSYVGRFQDYTGPIDDYPSTVNAYATRLDINSGNFTFNAEYVNKGRDPHVLNNNSFEKGKALLVNTSYTKNNFGITVTARAISNMDFRAEREVEFATYLPVNYVPALTKQHDYLTSNIYVYNPQTIGETGFQTDLYYTFKPKTKLGGKYGTKIAANFSFYGSLKDNKDLLSVGSNKYYSDANIEIKKKWSKKIETTLALQNIFYNASVIQVASHPDVVSNVVAFGLLYKYAPQKSVRVKLEHLSTKEDNGNWASAITEFSFASPYSFYVSDLYNYGVTGDHYYNFGASVTKNSTRFSLAFGKQRAGLFCVGGVCRFVPAAYGFTATLTSSFGN